MNGMKKTNEDLADFMLDLCGWFANVPDQPLERIGCLYCPHRPHQGPRHSGGRPRTCFFAIREIRRWGCILVRHVRSNPASGSVTIRQTASMQKAVYQFLVFGDILPMELARNGRATLC
jgi:hypothetical protein